MVSYYYDCLLYVSFGEERYKTKSYGKEVAQMSTVLGQKVAYDLAERLTENDMMTVKAE